LQSFISLHAGEGKETMNEQAAAYFTFGISLVVIFIAIIVFYYSKNRHKKVEEPKYKMLDDDE